MKGLRYSLCIPLATVGFLLMLILGQNVVGNKANAAGEFITTWKTNQDNASDASLTIPTYPGSTYDYTIDWGDGSSDTNVTGDASHTYATPGTYTVKISGTFPRIYINNYADDTKLQTVDAWGVIAWESMSYAFSGATNMTVTATDAPDLSNVTDLSGMFNGAVRFNTDVNAWDVSNVTDFSYMFRSNLLFNQDINAWDVSSALNMEGMFRAAFVFNEPLSNWDVSSVTNMTYMFTDARKFNQDLSGWRVPNVTSTSYMFYQAFDFNQDLSAWNVDNLEQAIFMLLNTSFSDENYNALLTGWAQDDVRSQVSFTGVPAMYCESVLDRNYLVQTKDWEISDDGVDSSQCAPTDIYFSGQTEPVVVENQQANTPIGDLETEDSDPTGTFVYDLACQGQYPDSSFFSVSNGQLVTNVSFDFDNPQDANADNIYQICIRSEDETGFDVEKEFSVQVTEEEEVVVSGGQVLSATTNSSSTTSQQSSGQVLAAGDESAMLASTGVNTTFQIIIGITTVVAAAYIYRKKSSFYYILRG